MISIFYSTRKKNKAKSLQIEKSCTLPNVEIIEFVNEGTLSLAEAYNNALKTSKRDILVCIHDDIELEKGWDLKIYEYFKNNPNFGIIGLAGTTDLSKSGMWWEDRNRMVGQVLHKHKDKWSNTKYSESFPNQLLPVITVDGLFIAIQKSKISKEFNENFKGFHFYDIPFCVDNYLEGVKIGVATDIVVKHSSIGVPNEQWHKNREQFVKEYSEKLPLNIVPNIFYDTKPVKLDKEPKMAVIIPSKDNFEFLERCINSIIDNTAYSNFTIYIADTGSDELTLDQTKNLIKSNDKIKLVCFDFYHFAKINNLMVRYHIDKDTELILFCNDDIEMVNDAISLMVQAHNKHQKHLGTIGCRLYYPNKTLQHGGIQLIIKANGHLGLTHFGIHSYFKGSHDKKFDVFGCTGAFLMIRSDVFYKLNGFTEDTIECIEDVILNIDCILNGFKNIYIGAAVCYHHESVSRKRNTQKNENEQKDMYNVFAPVVMKNIGLLKRYATIIR